MNYCWQRCKITLVRARIKAILRQGNSILHYVLLNIIQFLGNLFYRKRQEGKNCIDDGILVIRLDEIGDMVMMSSFLRELRRGYPKTHIALVVKPAVYNLVELCPYVDEILTFPKVNGRCAFYVRLFQSLCFSFRHFRKQRYSLALVPRFDADAGYGAGLLAFLSGAARRIGYSEMVLSSKSLSDKGYDGFYTNVLAPDPDKVRHEVERGIDVLHSLDIHTRDTGLDVWTSEQDDAHAISLLGEKGAQLRVALFLGAGSPRREWPVQSFIETAKILLRQVNIEWVILGNGKNEVEKAVAFFQSGASCCNLVNQLTLRETISVMRLCDMYLGGDTGPMHMAAALGKPGVVLSCHPVGGDENYCNSPSRFGPYNSDMTILRPIPFSGCEHGCQGNKPHCITRIPIEEVVQAVLHIAGRIKGEGGIG